MEGTRAAKRGFSLTEAMVGMALAGVILASCFSALAQGFRLVEGSRERMRATQILQNEVERLRALPWESLGELDGRQEVGIDPRWEAPYRNHFRLERVVEESRPEQRRVSLRVWWVRAGVERELRTETLVTQTGLRSAAVGGGGGG